MLFEETLYLNSHGIILHYHFNIIGTNKQIKHYQHLIILIIGAGGLVPIEPPPPPPLFQMLAHRANKKFTQTMYNSITIRLKLL